MRSPRERNVVGARIVQEEVLLQAFKVGAHVDLAPPKVFEVEHDRIERAPYNNITFQRYMLRRFSAYHQDHRLRTMIATRGGNLPHLLKVSGTWLRGVARVEMPFPQVIVSFCPDPVKQVLHTAYSSVKGKPLCGRVARRWNEIRHMGHGQVSGVPTDQDSARLHWIRTRAIPKGIIQNNLGKIETKPSVYGARDPTGSRTILQLAELLL
jgi:hypothetical protein